MGAVEVRAGRSVAVKARASDPRGLPLTAEWEIYREASEVRQGGYAEDLLDRFPKALVFGSPTRAVFNTSGLEPGSYRIFVTYRNGAGSAATANLPIHVLPPL